MSTNRPAIVLLSGGLDSATALAIAAAEGFELHALSFRYGQRHAVELDRAQQIAARERVRHHHFVDLDLGRLGGSALTADIAVPKHQSVGEIGTDIPITYVPARNTVFLAFALAYAETIPAFDLFIGVNAVDYSGYPDCRPEFIEAFERLANLATKASVQGQGRFRIHTPLIDLTKEEIIRKGLALGVDYSLTSSCYSPDPGSGAACGHCDSCLLRRAGFSAAGRTDPVAYMDL